MKRYFNFTMQINKVSVIFVIERRESLLTSHFAALPVDTRKKVHFDYLIIVSISLYFSYQSILTMFTFVVMV